VDEERESHFVVGRSRVNALDYHGAIESFTEALEANPRSASAHFELGVLYAERESDPAAAIYHYGQYLRLRPDAGNAEMVRQLIIRLKQELAQTVLPVTTAAETQQQMERMADDVRQLREELAVAKSRLAERSTPSNTAALPARSVARVNYTAQLNRTSGNAESRIAEQPSRRTTQTPTVTRRTHRVQAGETPSSIARRYGMKLESLLTANPGLDPRKLKVGQTLSVPAL
jgi:LysM repeat protein